MGRGRVLALLSFSVIATIQCDNATAPVDFPAPPPISDLAAARPSDTAVHLRWTFENRRPGEQVRVAFQVRYAPGDVDPADVPNGSLLIAEYSSSELPSIDLAVAGLTQGQLYSFRVRAKDGLDNWSAWSNRAVHATRNRLPIAVFALEQHADSISVDASASWDPDDAYSLLYRWDWESDGTWDVDWSASARATRRLLTPGEFVLSLEVRDPAGATSRVGRAYQGPFYRCVSQYDSLSLVTSGFCCDIQTFVCVSCNDVLSETSEECGTFAAGFGTSHQDCGADVSETWTPGLDSLVLHARVISRCRGDLVAQSVLAAGWTAEFLAPSNLDLSLQVIGRSGFGESPWSFSIFADRLLLFQRAGNANRGDFNEQVVVTLPRGTIRFETAARSWRDAQALLTAAGGLSLVAEPGAVSEERK